MTVVDMLDRPTYPYAEVDRLIGLSAGTARRWINGYLRGGKSHRPILREESAGTEWATWGEFVEARMLAEYRDMDIPTARLRETVAALRTLFGVRHPLAFLGPYLEADSGELTIRLEQLDPGTGDERMVVRTGEILLSEPSRAVVNRAALARDDLGREFVSQIEPDRDFPGIVVNPDRRGGEPTFEGRRVSVAMIAGLVAAGEDRVALAVDYGLSMGEIRAAVDYAARYGLAA